MCQILGSFHQHTTRPIIFFEVIITDYKQFIKVSKNRSELYKLNTFFKTKISLKPKELLKPSELQDLVEQLSKIPEIIEVIFLSKTRYIKIILVVLFSSKRPILFKRNSLFKNAVIQNVVTHAILHINHTILIYMAFILRRLNKGPLFIIKPTY